MKKILYFCLCLCVGATTAFAQASSAKLCAGSQANTDCLKSNLIELFHSDSDTYAKLMQKAANEATQCQDLNKAAALLSLSSPRQDGELAEDIGRPIEKLSVTNPKCFLNAAVTLSAKVQTDLAETLVDAVFQNSAEISQSLLQFQNEKQYQKFLALYLSKKNALKIPSDTMPPSDKR